MIKSELLAPAGDFEKACIALDYGADAVFLGGKAYSLRSKASNFFMNDIKKTCDYAHSKNKRVYVTVNVICHNALLNGFAKFIKDLSETGVDALIVADPYIIDYVSKNYPQLELHLSTQQSITNSKAALLWKDNGIKRIVLGREVSVPELKKLMANLKNQIEIEYFIHGAVCIAYSGRCMMSNNWSLRDSNVGGCAQSCRWMFELQNKNNSKTYSTKFTMSPKDMMLIDQIKTLMKIGVISFKVEGRMRSLNYVATVAKAYRQAIDFYHNKNNKTSEKETLKEIKKDLKYAENRPVGQAFSKGQPNIKAMLYQEDNRKLKQRFAFIVETIDNQNLIKVVARNNFKLNQIFTIFTPNHKFENLKLIKILDEQKKIIEVVKTPMKIYFLKFNKNLKLQKGAIGRIENKL